MKPTLCILALLSVAGCRFSVTGRHVSPDLATPGGTPDFAAVDLAVRDLAGADFAGQPAPGTPGWPCNEANECQSGFCIDHVCCDSQCDNRDPANLCKACNVVGHEGRCSFVSAGSDPRSECDVDTPASCGRDGTCDGNGACRLWRRGTACGVAVCVGNSVSGALCDGKGACTGGLLIDCTPRVCHVNQCE